LCYLEHIFFRVKIKFFQISSLHNGFEIIKEISGQTLGIIIKSLISIFKKTPSEAACAVDIPLVIFGSIFFTKFVKKFRERWFDFGCIRRMAAIDVRPSLCSSEVTLISLPRSTSLTRSLTFRSPSFAGRVTGSFETSANF
jgi:hypothetical protein